MDCINAKDFTWWKHGVIYHIYTRSFYDSNGDGIGDLQGIIDKVDYFIELGVNAIWLSPIYKSPQVDFGYDISNYREIENEYGDINDFKELLILFHSKGIKIIMDMVLNHTSNQHPWFLNSRKSINSEKRNFYIWSKKKPNNWKSTFERTGWSYDEISNEYYYHSFFQEQPDLNWRNPKVQEALFDEIKYWLELGVDGFRLDVINYITKDKKLRNDPSIFKQLLFNSKTYSRNRKTSIKIVSELQDLINSYDDRALVGEIYVLPPGDSKLVSSFLGRKLEALNLAFDFSLIFTKWSAKKYYNTINNIYKYLKPGACATIVFSNHDLLRSYSQPFNKKYRTSKAKLKSLLMFTLKGTPFVYYGEEIGMENTKISKKHIKDKLGKKYWPLYKGRDGARTPMQWNASQYSGFSTNTPWLPLNPSYKTNNVLSQQNDHNSLLNQFKKLISIRKETKILQIGEIQLISYANNVLVFKRFIDEKEIYVILNFSRFNKSVDSYQCQNILYTTHNTNAKISLDNNLKLRTFEGVIISKTIIYD